MKTSLLTLMLVGLMALTSQAQFQEWTGVISTDWNTPGNWSDNAVPTALNVVTIPAGTTRSPVLSTAGVSRALIVDGSLTIAPTGTLTLNGFIGLPQEPNPFRPPPPFISLRLLNDGVITNSGRIILGNNDNGVVTNYGIFNRGTLNNQPGGEILIDSNRDAGLRNSDGGVSNAGKLTIGATLGVGQFGIDTQNSGGTFTNSAGGEIRIDRCTGAGIRNLNNFRGGSFANAGKIIIGANASVGNYGIYTVAGSSSFNNRPGGEISINNSTVAGWILGGVSLTNAGRIAIGANTSVGEYGLNVDNTAFSNLPGGEISLDNSTVAGLKISGVLFTENGVVYGITNNTGRFIIGARASVGDVGITNSARFNNDGCSALIDVVANAVITNTGSFTNSGTILENASGNSNISSNTGIIQNRNGGTFDVGTGPNQPLSLSLTNPSACNSSNGSVTLTGLQANTSYTLSYTVGGSATTLISAPISNANGQFTIPNLRSGVYAITLGGLCAGLPLTLSATLTDPPNPTATLAASGSITCTSTSVMLTASPAGQASYAFSSGASQIGGSSGNTATAMAAGAYSVTLTTANGCTASATTTVADANDSPLVITSQPAAASSVGVGAITTATVAVSGTGSLSYQWFKDNTGSPVPNQTSATLTLTNVQLADAGRYFVVVTGPCNRLTSSEFLLTVNLANTAPVATTNPSQTATVGVPFFYTVNAFTDPEGQPLTYAASVLPDNGLGFNPAIRSLTGTPRSPGVSTVTLTATDPGSLSASTTFTITVNPPPIVVTPLSLNVTASPTTILTTGTTTLSATVSGGTPGSPDRPYSYTFSGPGTITPSGNTATVTNLPAGVQTFTVQVADATSPTPQTTTGTISVTVSEPAPANQAPTTTGIANQNGTVGQTFSLNVAASFADPNGDALSFTATNLPAGLSLAGILISGTPSMSGVSNVTVRATDPGSLSVSTTFIITISPATVVVPPPTATFSITGVTTVSCATVTAGQRMLVFAPRYAGLSGQPVTFRVLNESLPTTAPGPYTLRVYTDNPTITLKATQTGTPAEASFSYNWLAACNGGDTPPPPPTNQAPTTTGIPNQNGTAGQSFSLNLAPSFADPNGDALSFTAANLPAGLSLTGSTISGTPSVSGVSTVSITATDPGSLFVNTSFLLSVSPVSVGLPPTAPFSITGVTMVSCQVVSGGERRLSFTPRYAGLSGQPISFRVLNESLPTTQPGPYTLRVYTDNPTITLKATQTGTPGEASFSYNWLATCTGGSGARVGTEPVSLLNVRVLGNPAQAGQVSVEVRGAAGEPLHLTLTDTGGKTVGIYHLEAAGSVERHTFEVSRRSAGLLLLRVSTPTQSRTLRVLTAD